MGALGLFGKGIPKGVTNMEGHEERIKAEARRILISVFLFVCRIRFPCMRVKGHVYIVLN